MLAYVKYQINTGLCHAAYVKYKINTGLCHPSLRQISN